VIVRREEADGAMEGGFFCSEFLSSGGNFDNVRLRIVGAESITSLEDNRDGLVIAGVRNIDLSDIGVVRSVVEVNVFKDRLAVRQGSPSSFSCDYRNENQLVVSGACIAAGSTFLARLDAEELGNSLTTAHLSKPGSFSLT